MRGFAKILVRLVFAIILVVVLTLAAFRGWAVLRETMDSHTGTGNVVTVGGLGLRYSEWGPEGGPVLLMIPGTLAWSQTWRDIAVPLGEAGFRVIALDLPPFGYSERPVDGIYGRSHLSAMILGFGEALHLKRYTLVGHSFGGGATIEAAMRNSERVEALVLLDVALGLQAEAGSAGLRALLSIAPLRSALASTTFANPLFTGAGLRNFIHDDEIVTPERIALYQAPLSMRGTSEAIGDWLLTGLLADERGTPSADRTAYGQIDLPTLVIWGREDTVTPLSQGEDLADLLPRSELVVLDGVNHIPHVEAPRAVVAAIVDFMEKTSSQQTAPGRQDRLEQEPRTMN